MFSVKSRSWRIRDKFRQDSSESTSTQASVSIREFELFREFCTSENLAGVAAGSTGASSSFDNLVCCLLNYQYFLCRCLLMLSSIHLAFHYSAALYFALSSPPARKLALQLHYIEPIYQLPAHITFLMQLFVNTNCKEEA